MLEKKGNLNVLTSDLLIRNFQQKRFLYRLFNKPEQQLKQNTILQRQTKVY